MRSAIEGVLDQIELVKVVRERRLVEAELAKSRPLGVDRRDPQLALVIGDLRREPRAIQLDDMCGCGVRQPARELGDRGTRELAPHVRLVAVCANLSACGTAPA